MATLVTDGGGHRVPELALTPRLLIDRTTVIYGPSKTGKTVLVKNFMQRLRGHIDQALVVAPTEPSNRSYDGYVDPCLIHYRMSLPADPSEKKTDTEQKAALRFLERVYQRQEMMAAIYTRANSPDTLAALYARLPRTARTAGDGYIDSLQRKRKRAEGRVRRLHTRDPGLCAQKVKEANAMFEKMVNLVYKQTLTENMDFLRAQKDLREDERCSLHYLNFNPRLLLIFDDCAAQLKPFFSKEIFRKLFYQNRHSFITMIICCQDDTDLPANLRKNAFISIFTEAIVCLSNFDRISNRFPKATKAYVAEILPSVFIGHRKLAYIREDDRRQHFYHLTCEFPRPFLFGSEALAELCAAVRSEGVAMDTGNPFYEKFRV